MLIPFGVLLILTSFFLGLFSYQSSRTYIQNRVLTLNMEIADQIADNVQFLLDDLMDTSTFLCINSDVQMLVSKPAVEGEKISQNDLYENFKSMDFTKYIYGSKKHLSCIAIYGKTNDPVFFSSSGTGILPYDLSELRESEIFTRIMESKGAPYWFTIEKGDHFFLHNNLSRKIALGRAIKNKQYSANEGLLFFCLDDASIIKICKEAIHEDRVGIVIYESTGSLIAQAGEQYDMDELKLPAGDHSDSTNESNIQTYRGEQIIVSHRQMPQTDWTVYYVYPMSNISPELNHIKELTIVIIVVFQAIVILLTFLLTLTITKPINQLIGSMKRFETGNFEEQVHIARNDEMGMLGKGFNTMVQKIKELVENVYVLQINKQELMIKEREAELDALQAQINPHFLYNTLDTIYWKAFGGNENETEISEMVYSLSRIFRLSINRGDSFSSVTNEKELVENYLKLQKIRFKGSLQYEIHFDPSIEAFPIPKLIVQPFVENALIHGLEGNQSEIGFIHIRGFEDPDELVFIIEDNGVGMTAKEIKAILSGGRIKKAGVTRPQGGYAIKNITERLKLIYGDRYSLNIKSKIGHGTRIELRIPKIWSDLSKKEIP
jgi:two-component system sensor histidine kinase YesM